MPRITQVSIDNPVLLNLRLEIAQPRIKVTRGKPPVGILSYIQHILENEDWDWTLEFRYSHATSNWYSGAKGTTWPSLRRISLRTRGYKGKAWTGIILHELAHLLKDIPHSESHGTKFWNYFFYLVEKYGGEAPRFNLPVVTMPYAVEHAETYKPRLSARAVRHAKAAGKV